MSGDQYKIEWDIGKNYCILMFAQEAIGWTNNVIFKAIIQTIEGNSLETWHQVVTDSYQPGPNGGIGQQTTTNFDKVVQEYWEKKCSPKHSKDIMICAIQKPSTSGLSGYPLPTTIIVGTQFGIQLNNRT